MKEDTVKTMSTLNELKELESGSPLGNADGFRRALGHFTTGVTIVTAATNGECAGLTANSFTSVSLDPPLILWAVKRSSTSWPVFAASKSFAVNVLAADQAHLATQFARSATDKFKDVEWMLGQSGAPLLANVTSHFECIRRVEYEGGDHLIVVGEVTRFARYDRRPLVFLQGRFSTAIDGAEFGQSCAGGSSAQRLTLLTMLRRAFVRRAAEFGREAQALGFSVNESRVAYFLGMAPGATVESLAASAQLDLDAARDAVAALRERGWVVRSVNDSLQLTASGTEQNAKLGVVARSAEAERLKSFSAAEVDTARRVLAALGVDEG
jgi:4-hydroxyphenylacetate 3-hydroxylase, reductase component